MKYQNRTRKFKCNYAK